MMRNKRERVDSDKLSRIPHGAPLGYHYYGSGGLSLHSGVPELLAFGPFTDCHD